MWRTDFEIRLKKLFAKILYKTKDDHTPVTFDEYYNNEYYYIVNNNYNNIYSLEEFYRFITTKDKLDPFTRLPICSYDFVKVKIKD